MKVAVIVPVSPFESEEIVLKSVTHLKNLEWNDIEHEILYVVDRSGSEDERGKIVEENGCRVLIRDDRRGKRAGAINDALKLLEMEKPEYVAIFDVDSRPERDFIIKCLEALDGCDECFIASGRRVISNTETLVSETVDAEYRLINYLLEKSAFKHFNGLIGVLRGDVLMEEKLSEDMLTEDSDFSTRMYGKGKKAMLVDTYVYEQAPLTWGDFFNQRRRWYYGGIQLWRHRKLMAKAEWKVRISWIMMLTLTYVPVIYAPLTLLLSPILILKKWRKLRKLKIVLGLMIYTFVLQAAAIAAVKDYLTGKEAKWGAIKRSEC